MHAHTFSVSFGGRGAAAWQPRMGACTPGFWNKT